MSNYAIRVENLSKQYRIGVREERHDTLGGLMVDWVRRPWRNWRRLQQMRTAGEDAADDAIWALKDVAFDVHHGEVVGIIGRNGAGKSTLLKIISNITKPTRGRVVLNGRVASLLEVGTGFHPELTGRENVYLNGTILGMHKPEIDRKFDEIVEFAGVSRFIDTPVKRYSNGMLVRLAFSVAAHLEPEILLIDEVLAVGDTEFQEKCLGKMGSVVREGRTVLFVSHNMAAVQQLTRNCVVLGQGSVLYIGPTAGAIETYLSNAQGHVDRVYRAEKYRRALPDHDRRVEFVSVELVNGSSNIVAAEDDIQILARVRGNQDVAKFRFCVTVHGADGHPIGTMFGREENSIRAGEETLLSISLSNVHLARGSYFCTITVGIGDHLTRYRDFDALSNVLHFELMAPKASESASGVWWSEWGTVRFPSPQVIRVPQEQENVGPVHAA